MTKYLRKAKGEVLGVSSGSDSPQPAGCFAALLRLKGTVGWSCPLDELVMAREQGTRDRKAHGGHTCLCSLPQGLTSSN